MYPCDSYSPAARGQLPPSTTSPWFAACMATPWRSAARSIAASAAVHNSRDAFRLCVTRLDHAFNGFGEPGRGGLARLDAIGRGRHVHQRGLGLRRVESLVRGDLHLVEVLRLDVQIDVHNRFVEIVGARRPLEQI